MINLNSKNQHIGAYFTVFFNKSFSCCWVLTLTVIQLQVLYTLYHQIIVLQMLLVFTKIPSDTLFTLKFTLTLSPFLPWPLPSPHTYLCSSSLSSLEVLLRSRLLVSLTPFTFCRITVSSVICSTSIDVNLHPAYTDHNWNIRHMNLAD